MDIIFTLKEAEDTDYKAVKELYSQYLKRLAHNYPTQYRPEGAERSITEDTFLNALSNPDWAFFIIKQEEKTIALIQLSVDQDEDNHYRFPHRYVWIEELIVHPDYFQAEIVQTLLEKARQWADLRQIKDIDYILYHFDSQLQPLLEAQDYQTVSTRLRRHLS